VVSGCLQHLQRRFPDKAGAREVAGVLLELAEQSRRYVDVHQSLVLHLAKVAEGDLLVATAKAMVGVPGTSLALTILLRRALVHTADSERLAITAVVWRILRLRKKNGGDDVGMCMFLSRVVLQFKTTPRHLLIVSNFAERTGQECWQRLAQMLQDKQVVPCTAHRSADASSCAPLGGELGQHFSFDHLRSRIVAQHCALHRAERQFRLRRQGGAHKPLVILMLGPSGTGKTETARMLASIKHQRSVSELEQDGFFKTFHMTQFGSPDTAHTFFGPPEGIKGEGDLPNVLSRRGDAVVLLDEIEKAHQSFSESLLKVLGEHGVVYDAKNGKRDVPTGAATFLLTSNFAKSNISEFWWEYQAVQPGDSDDSCEFYDGATRRIQRLLSTHSRDNWFRASELRGRIDLVLIFRPFTVDEVDAAVVTFLKEHCSSVVQNEAMMKPTIRWTDAFVRLFRATYQRNSDEGLRRVHSSVSETVSENLMDAFDAGLLYEFGMIAHFDARIDEDGYGQVALTMERSCTQSTWSFWATQSTEASVSSDGESGGLAATAGSSQVQTAQPTEVQTAQPSDAAGRGSSEVLVDAEVEKDWIMYLQFQYQRVLDFLVEYQQVVLMVVAPMVFMIAFSYPSVLLGSWNIVQTGFYAAGSAAPFVAPVLPLAAHVAGPMALAAAAVWWARSSSWVTLAANGTVVLAAALFFKSVAFAIVVGAVWGIGCWVLEAPTGMHVIPVLVLAVWYAARRPSRRTAVHGDGANVLDRVKARGTSTPASRGVGSGLGADSGGASEEQRRAIPQHGNRGDEEQSGETGPVPRRPDGGVSAQIDHVRLSLSEVKGGHTDACRSEARSGQTDGRRSEARSRQTEPIPRRRSSVEAGAGD